MLIRIILLIILIIMFLITFLYTIAMYGKHTCHNCRICYVYNFKVLKYTHCPECGQELDYFRS